MSVPKFKTYSNSNQFNRILIYVTTLDAHAEA